MVAAGTGERTGTKQILGAETAAWETDEMLGGRGRLLGDSGGTVRDPEQRSWTLQVHRGQGSGETVELSTEGGAERARPPETGEERGSRPSMQPGSGPACQLVSRVTPSMRVSPQNKARARKAMPPLVAKGYPRSQPRRPYLAARAELAGQLGDDTHCHWPFPRVSAECVERVTVSMQDAKCTMQNSQVLTFVTRPVTSTPTRHRTQDASLEGHAPEWSRR